MFSGQAGLSLLEVTVGIAIFAVMIWVLGLAITAQANLFGQAADQHRTLVPAQVAIQRIRSELKTAVNGSPGYALSGTSISYRPVIGYISPSDATFNAKKGQGLVSSNSIEYSPVRKTIVFSASPKTVSLTAVNTTGGSLPAGVRATETLCEDVEVFQFFDGDSVAATAPAAVTSTVVIGVHLEARRVSASPGNKGGFATSNAGAGSGPESVIMTTKVRVLAELLVNSNRGAVTGS